MNLFIDAVSSGWIIILFDQNRQIIDRKEIEVLLNESSMLLSELDSFMDKNNTAYEDIKNIVVVNWPWSFTGLRTIVLIVNTLNYIINANITPINYFELFDSYPIIKSSSKRDVFFKESKGKEIEILSNDKCTDLLKSNNIEIVYWDLSNDFFEDILLKSSIDYERIIKEIVFENKKMIEPLYMKKPNIS